ncbi:MAG TPA: methyltransferase domain-containing protein [Candidatus Desulfofervidus auxilii]|uniref:Methyltransferase domain-containing protein n=1 Tax=Desulfofervidus auxilii TaxID=1621989 RepID=A0A7V0I9T9_DESA2|nr:methyltransferase domain-containing protein [Candidatus Desulfofervidus auxilii]
MDKAKIYIMRILGGYGNSQILNTALEFDIFTHIANGANNIEELAIKTNTDKKALSILLDALIALNLLKKQNDSYCLTPISETYLVKDKPQYMGDFRYTALWAYEGMVHLKETVKTGRSVQRLGLENPDSYWEKLGLGLAHFTRPSADYVCRILNDLPEKAKVLDIGGGCGIFAATLLKHYSTIDFYQLDLAEVNQMAREFLASEGIDVDKAHFIDGDVKKTELPKEHFNLVILSNICHHEDPLGNMELFKKAYKTLVFGGKIIINDFFVNDNYSSPRFSLLFRTMLLVMNSKGEVYRFKEYKEWLNVAGFKDIEIYHPIPKTYEDVAIIIGHK